LFLQFMLLLKICIGNIVLYLWFVYLGQNNSNELAKEWCAFNLVNGNIISGEFLRRKQIPRRIVRSQKNLTL